MECIQNPDNNKKERISIAVLMSTYNGEKYLAEQIESILAQQGDFDLRLYIRDDGSKDSTVEILKKYQERYQGQNKIYGFYEENRGITESYFRLLHYVREQWNPDYYSLSDQDDIWLPEKLQCAINTLEKEKKIHEDIFPLLYGCRSFLVNEKLEKTGQLTQKQLRPLTIYNTAIQNILLGHNQVFNACLVNELLSKELNYAEIYAHDMWITQVASIKGRIVFENEPHTLYRQHGDNELGYGSGAGSFKWIAARIKRAFRGESHLVAKQTRYLLGIYDTELRADQKNAVKTLFHPGADFIKRVHNGLSNELYRQRKTETIMFRILYIMNQYD